MKKIVIITVILSVLSLAGCCRKSVSTHRTDSVRVAVHTEYIERLRDTAVYVQIPPEGRSAVARDSSFLETAVAASKARINEDGSLYHDLHTKTQRIPVTVQVKDIYKADSERSEEVHRETAAAAAKKPLSGFKTFLVWSGAGLWTMLLAAAGHKLLKR